jgi:phosphatidylserine/phosphatidylglycerophosphate/cardiolipin synthase-like enzyme
MDPVKLATAEAAAAEWEAHFLAAAAGADERKPVLDFKRFPVKNLSAAVSPDCSFRLLRDVLNTVEVNGEILLYIYNLTADHLVEILATHARNGVKMRIMYDAIDTNGGELDKVQALRQAGASVKVAPSTGARRVFAHCHQKFVVVDRRVVALGSANWAGTAIPNVVVKGTFKKGNREWLVRIDDGDVAQWFATLFDADWDIPALPGGQGLVDLPPDLLAPVAVPAMLVAAPGMVYDIEPFTLADAVEVVPVVSPDNYYAEVKDMIDSATKSIYIQQQYILAGGRVNDLLSAVEKRRQEGVDVRVIVSPAFRKIGEKDNWEISRDTLDAFGLKDRLRALNLEYFTHCHNKGVIVDREKVVVSSTNWSSSSIQKAREAGVLIVSGEVAGYYARVFETDWDELSWDEADVPDNLAKVAVESMFQPGGFLAVEPGELL